MDVETKKKHQEYIPGPTDRKAHRLWIAGYIITAFGCLFLYFLLQSGWLRLPATYQSWLLRLSFTAFVVFVVFALTRGVEWLMTKKSTGRRMHYNVIRLIRLLSVLIAIFIGVTFLFEKWYTAAVSLGLVSLILGFALQTPISSLIGWFYIIIRTPYRIGDRIQVGDFTGDVVEIGYLDTTLWEFHGEYLSNDVPSGRLIRFPNTLILQAEVYNYSWQKFPFIWNEIPFHVAYESDLNFVENVIRLTALQEIGGEMTSDIERFKALVKQTPVDEFDIKEYPFVSFRVNANTWIEVTVTYLVSPKKASAVRSRLVKRIVAALLQEPEKVMFPKSNSR
jgi:small-conductance mechanosensitive channel